MLACQQDELVLHELVLHTGDQIHFIASNMQCIGLYVALPSNVNMSCMQVIGQSAAAGVGISGSWPSSLHQFVPTTVRVTLNTSACSQLGEVRRKIKSIQLGRCQSITQSL